MNDEAAPEPIGLARERTVLAWTRTGLSFTVAGAFLLRAIGSEGTLVLELAVGLVLLGSLAWLWGWRSPEPQPAVDSRLGRATVRMLGVGTALVAVAAIGVELAS